MTPRPLVFVSAVSSDLASARRVVVEALHQIECSPVEESLAGTEYGRIQDMLRRWIDPCQAVIHIVGRDYGGEPDPASLPETQARRSWTQLEYDYAIEQNKKLYVIVCDDSFPYDESTPEPDDKRELQQAHRQAVLNGEYLWNQVTSEDDLKNAVLRMKLPLEELRAELRRRQVRQRWIASLAAVAVVLLLGGAIYGLGQLAETGEQALQTTEQVKADTDTIKATTDQIESDTTATKKTAEKIKQSTEQVRELWEKPEQLAERMRQHIRDRSKSKLAAARERKAKWDEIRELERRRDVALEKVDDLIRTIQQGLQGQPDEVFREASRILAEEGVDAAIGYLASHEEDIGRRVDKLIAEERLLEQRAAEKRAEKRQALEPLLLKADLHETNLEFTEARALYETVADKAPEWSRARRELGHLLDKLAEFKLAEPHLVAALELAHEDDEWASAANFLGISYLRQARYAEAEPLLTEFLDLTEQIYGENHTETAKALNNLAQLLQDTNRLAQAEPLIRRALAINEQSYGTEHPSSVAINLNNLATLLQATNRLREAEPLMRRALAIDERSYGAEHPDVAKDLNNLATLLHDGNRLAEAEPLMRRALGIDEQSFGAEHPKVAIRLNNLARLLQDKAEALDSESQATLHEEAEPLMRRALAIFAMSLVESHPNTVTVRDNYRQLLHDMQFAEAEIEQRVKGAMEKQGPLEPIAPEVERLLGPRVLKTGH